ncbi:MULTISPECIES: hypothetical protein [unclassified Streptomyces]|uniref:hypothetical protein n=1 Tax=unclassified Streptomyces TaxID=2593676 RepID=UPI00130127DE|nr:hypothetical protein [Streptomyces sp. CB01883]
MAMRPLALGAVIGLLLVLFGLSLAPLAVVLPLVVQPVTVAFVLGAVTRPHLRRWAR